MRFAPANETQETEAGLPVTPNPAATLVLRAVEDHSNISPPTPEPPEAPAVNPHFLSDADVQLFQQGTQGNCGGVQAGPVNWHHQPYSLRLALPPLSASFFLKKE
jgi:hypothetical protein